MYSRLGNLHLSILYPVYSYISYHTFTFTAKLQYVFVEKRKLNLCRTFKLSLYLVALYSVCTFIRTMTHSRVVKNRFSILHLLVSADKKHEKGTHNTESIN